MHQVPEALAGRPFTIAMAAEVGVSRAQLRGVACGWTAAWLHGVDVRRRDDVTVHVGFPSGKRIRSRSGIEICQETLDLTDVVEIDGVRVTTPVRTAFDCLRWLYYVDGVVVSDALSHAEFVHLGELRAYFASKRRLRNLRIGERLLELVDPKSESPKPARTLHSTEW